MCPGPSAGTRARETSLPVYIWKAAHNFQIAEVRRAVSVSSAMADGEDLRVRVNITPKKRCRTPNLVYADGEWSPKQTS